MTVAGTDRLYGFWGAGSGGDADCKNPVGGIGAGIVMS